MGGFVDMARMMYDELGFDTLPLIPGSKRTYARAWQRRLPYRLWQNAPERANIGIRGGGFAGVAAGLVCADTQNAAVVSNATAAKKRAVFITFLYYSLR